MRSKNKRIAAWAAGSVCALSLICGLALAGGETKAVDPVFDYIFGTSETGASIVTRLAGLESRQVTDASMRTFMARLSWADNAALRAEINSGVSRIKTELEQYRLSKNRPAKLEEGKPLEADEKEFIEKAAATLRSPTVEDMVLANQKAFIDATTRAGNTGKGTLNDSEYAFSKDPGEVPARVDPKATAFKLDGDLRKLQLAWWRKFFMRTRALGRLVSAVTWGEGDFRSLFSRAGKPMTYNDLLTVRKLVRVFGAMNPYANFRMLMRAAANEPSVVVTRLFELGGDATAEYSRAAFLTTPKAYVDKLRLVGKTQNLALNDVWYDGMERSLVVLERCYTLGGRVDGGVLVPGELARAEAVVEKGIREIGEIQADILSAKAARNKPALRRLRAHLDVVRERLSIDVNVLEEKSFEFMQNREFVEVFANLRNGMINSEPIQRFDMPDVFAVQQKQLDAWEPLYGRAIARSVNQPYKQELVTLVKEILGDTRKLVRGLNKATTQVNGRKFTDTVAGKKYQDYARSKLTALTIKIAKVAGIAVPAAIVDEITDHQIKRIFKAIVGLGDDDDAQGKGGKAPAGGSK